jgi:hypothetical protein
MIRSASYEAVSPDHDRERLMPQLLGPPARKQAMEESSSSNGKVVAAIVVTAAITLAIAVIFFFIYLKFAKKREKVMATSDELKKVSRKVKKFTFDENGQGLLYVKSFDRKPKNTFSKVTLNPSYEEEGEEKRVDVIVEQLKKYEPQEVLLSSYGIGHGKVTEPVLRNGEPTASVTEMESPKLPPLQSPPRKKIPPPPPPPPPPPTSTKPPLITKKNPASPPPPPKIGGLISLLKPPPVPRGKLNSKSREWAPTEGSLRGTSSGHTKLKPLHWDKVTADVDHSVVWDEINNGSLRFPSEF